MHAWGDQGLRSPWWEWGHVATRERALPHLVNCTKRIIDYPFCPHLLLPSDLNFFSPSKERAWNPKNKSQSLLKNFPEEDLSLEQLSFLYHPSFTLDRSQRGKARARAATAAAARARVLLAGRARAAWKGEARGSGGGEAGSWKGGILRWFGGVCHYYIGIFGGPNLHFQISFQGKRKGLLWRKNFKEIV